MITKIKLTNGDYTLIDNDDLEKTYKFKWYIHPQGYAQTHSKGKCILLHRLIMNTPKGLETDHINGDKLDNRKENLRICTRFQNKANLKRYARKGKVSVFKGVNLEVHGKYKYWVAAIQKNNKQIRIGSFPTETEAARAYNKVAKELFGEFAKFNNL